MLIEDYAEYIGEKDLGLVYNILWECSNNALYMEWLQANPKTEIERGVFYIHSRMYLPELVRFNNNNPETTRRIVEFCKEYKIERVLDIGCGIGTHLIELMKEGIECCGLEINRECKDFFWYRIKKYNLTNKIMCVPDYPKFDLIICLDVFEHLDNAKRFFKLIDEKAKYIIVNYSSNFDILMHTNIKELEDYKCWIENKKHIRWSIYEND